VAKWVTGRVGAAAARLWAGWTRLVQAVFGAWDWQAPPWAQGLARLLRERPRTVAVVLCAALGLVGGGVGIWRWIQHRPKPEAATFAATLPGRTRIEEENAKPDPLVLRFDRSVAPLALAGKAVGAGVTLQPDLAGTWRWLDDRTLEFRPKTDWPIGQNFAVHLDRAAVAPQIRLAEDALKFQTVAFSGRVVATNFYQDPVNPGVKFGVFDLQFTYPVDPATLEKQIELRLAGQSAGVLGVGRETTTFTVVYDKLHLSASVHSASLPIPKDPTELQLKVDAGVRALRGGNATEAPITAAARVPGLYSLQVQGVQPLVVSNERNEPEQVLMLSLSAATGERDVATAVKAWLLPAVRPAQAGLNGAGSAENPYPWWNVHEITAEVLERGSVLPLEPIPAEREFIENHSFRYHADVGRSLYVEVQKNLRSFGGYLSPQTERYIVRVPPFPPELKILSQGSLLALSGERKVAVLVRDLPGLRIDIARLLPAQLQHWVSQADGDFSNPNFYGGFGPDNVTERFTRKVPLGALAHGEAHYETVDLGEYLVKDGAEKRGIFLLSVSSYDPKAEAARRRARAAGTQDADGAADQDAPSDDDGERAGGGGDKRLVLVTDLGILMKRSADGTEDVFVQSIASGLPVPAAMVEVVAKNGSVLVSQATDASGRAHFQKLDGLTRERTPLFVQVRKAGDLSFLPLKSGDRSLDTSRFDVGGVHNARSAGQLSAYLFSDRGIYRPGDTFHIGMITKTADWSRDLAGIPLEAEVQDARGLTVQRERIKLPAGGFNELKYTTADTAPAGNYSINLYIVKDNRPDAQIGTTSVRVQDFEPDRMKITAHLSAESADGWVAPSDLKALVNVQNLFGTPAEQRRVEATLTLTPAFPAFRSHPDYRFYDPLRAKEGYSDTLKATTTDAQGNANFDLGLQKYARATYRVHLLARAFEPAGGRSVTADAGVLVSEMPFLVGFKTDGDLGYVSRDSRRSVAWIAIDPNAKPTAATGLTLKRVETKFVSVLTKETNGTYKYESRKKDLTLSEQPWSVTAAGEQMPLATDTPGTFAYVIRDAAGLELNRVEYTVVGAGNVTRSLERNAELQITLNKKDYAPGEDIELSIKAPYTGAGLITIERDHVVAAEWFKSGTTASVQKIRLPADFEGNGYVTVQFIRDPATDEIFTSPLSFGIAPFATSLAARTQTLTLKAPERVKPGDTLHLQLGAGHPTRAVVFAVDEGILQVAHYQTPDPLGEFFKKRALEVRTSQILDLILPEFKRLMAAAAPGGDGEAALRRNLNPFKRKHDKPAVYWSGLVDVDGRHEFTWTVPDTFNGSLKVFAVAVDAASIGVAQAETLVRGDFVLTPNMPTAVAPGDEFDVSVGVANNVLESGAGAEVQLSASMPAQLEVIGSAQQTVKVPSGREGVAVFHLRARAVLGAATVRFTAAWQDRHAHLTGEVSVRPASPHLTEVTAGFFGSALDVPIRRSVYPDFRKLEVGVSTLPLVLAGGLGDYLADYPHLCTEQLVSRGFSALVQARRPELAGTDAARARPLAAAADALIAVLRTRQNAEGGFGLWQSTVAPDEFASVYALHWMIEARDQGLPVPVDLLQRGQVWLQTYAASPVPDDGSAGLAGLRNRAYATYLLTRQGMVTTPIVSSLRETLDARHPKLWHTDASAAYLAAVYKLQHQDREAASLIGPAAAAIGTVSGHGFADYSDDTVRDAQILYLLSRHFPDRAANLKPAVLQAMIAPLARGEYNTLSAAMLALAFDAYAAANSGAGLDKFAVTESGPGGQSTPLELKGKLILHAGYAGETRQLHLSNDTGLTGFFAVVNAGFDREPPLTELRQGIEILREYLDDKGQPVERVASGAELTVRLRMRAIDQDFIGNVAIIDLLPGGFEPVVAPPPAPSAGASNDEDAQGDGDAQGAGIAGGGAPGRWQPVFADVRDDRVVVYGTLTKDLAEYTYRIRATNSGSFLVPPSIAESMYDRTLRARAAAGHIQVVQP
jgi:uncharacterized protein YfaS (alpha-2-macroglobulin family)